MNLEFVFKYCLSIFSATFVTLYLFLSNVGLDPKLCDCKDLVKFRIINGTVISGQGLDWTASLFIKYKNLIKHKEYSIRFQHWCTASAVGSKWFITASYCFEHLDQILNYKNITEYDLFIGISVDHQLKTIFENDNNYIMVKNYYSNPNKINNKFGRFDVTLVELSESFELGGINNIYPSCLLDFDVQIFVNNFKLASYGVTSFIKNFTNPVKNQLKLNSTNYSLDLNDSIVQDHLAVSKDPHNFLIQDHLTNLTNQINLLSSTNSIGLKNDLNSVLPKRIKRNTISFEDNSLVLIDNLKQVKCEELICAKSEDSSVCQLDTGAGLLYKIDDKLYIVGILIDSELTNSRFCKSNVTNKYAPIYPNMDWISDYVQEDRCFTNYFLVKNPDLFLFFMIISINLLLISFIMYLINPFSINDPDLELDEFDNQLLDSNLTYDKPIEIKLGN